MLDEKNIIEEAKKKPIDIWKVALISLVSISIFATSGIWTSTMVFI